MRLNGHNPAPGQAYTATVASLHPEEYKAQVEEAWKAMREWVRCLSFMHEVANRVAKRGLLASSDTLGPQ